MNFVWFALGILQGVVFTVTAHCQTPQKPEDLGLTFHQKAYRVNGQVVWMDEAALKRDFPELMTLSADAIKSWIIHNFSFVTQEQLVLRGNVLPEFEYDAKNPRLVFHPFSYHRSAVAVAESPQVAGEGIGLVDLKGVGWGTAPFDIEKWRGRSHIPTMISIVQGKVPATSSLLRWVRAHLAAAKTELKEDLENLKKPLKADDPSYMAHFLRHARHTSSDSVKLWTFIERVVVMRTSLLTKWWAQRSTAIAWDISRFAALVKRADYTTGSVHLARAMKEVIVQKTAQQLINEEVSRNQSHIDGHHLDRLPSTIDNYFLIALPWDVTVVGSTSRAAILGRRAHWRFSTSSRLEHWPSEMKQLVPKSIRDVFSTVQTSHLWEIVDFENIAIEHPDYPELHVAHDQVSGSIDLKAYALVNAWSRDPGGHSIAKWIDSQLPRLRPANTAIQLPAFGASAAAPESRIGAMMERFLAGDTSEEFLSELGEAFVSNQMPSVLIALLLTADKGPERTAKVAVALVKHVLASKVASWTVEEDGKEVFIYEAYEALYIAIHHLYWRLLKNSPADAEIVKEFGWKQCF